MGHLATAMCTGFGLGRASMTVVHRLEAAAAWAGLALLRRLSPARASDLGGAVARAIGPHLPVSRIADDNLRRAIPELTPAGRRRVVRGVWDNLGRTVAELPHVAGLRRTPSGPGWEIDAASEAVMRDMAAQRGPVLFFSGHLGNWELLPVAAAAFGMPLGIVYRPAANRAVDGLIAGLRSGGSGGPMFAKGSDGARGALRHLSGGGALAMLVDQKMNDGISVPFFGRPAWTAPALAAFALRYRCPVVPAYARRIGPARLRLFVEPPLALPQSRRADAVAALMSDVNARLERWISQAPDQWLWLHRRWPKPGA